MLSSRGFNILSLSLGVRVGVEPLDLTDWAVEDDSDFRYEFPPGLTLQADAEVTLRTGKGSDTEADLYWGWSAQSGTTAETSSTSTTAAADW